MIEYLGNTSCAARWSGLRQVLQALAKILLGLAIVEGRRTGLLAELVSRVVNEYGDMSVGGWLQP